MKKENLQLYSAFYAIYYFIVYWILGFNIIKGAFELIVKNNTVTIYHCITLFIIFYTYYHIFTLTTNIIKTHFYD